MGQVGHIQLGSTGGQLVMHAAAGSDELPGLRLHDVVDPLPCRGVEVLLRIQEARRVLGADGVLLSLGVHERADELVPHLSLPGLDDVGRAGGHRLGAGRQCQHHLRLQDLLMRHGPPLQFALVHDGLEGRCEPVRLHGPRLVGRGRSLRGALNNLGVKTCAVIAITGTMFSSIMGSLGPAAIAAPVEKRWLSLLRYP